MTGDTISTDMNVGYRWKVVYNGGWARNYIEFFGKADTSATTATHMFGIGGYGENKGWQYAWLGPSYDSNYTIRIYPGSGPTIGGNIIYHAGNLPTYPTVNNGALYL